MSNIKSKYQTEAVEMLTTFRKSHANAPSRSSYNRLTGSYAKTKKDLVRDFKANWAMNQACYEVEANATDKVMDVDIDKRVPDPKDTNPLLDD